jgi:hypothetical protein
MNQMRKSWDMDRASKCRYLKKDSDRAAEILLEEGFSFVGAGISSETFERINEEGVKETVVLFRALANGTMLITKEGSGDQPRRIKAYQYIREMRPSMLRKCAEAMKKKHRSV